MIDIPNSLFIYQHEAGSNINKNIAKINLNKTKK